MSQAAQFSAGGGLPPVNTLTPDSGGIVGPSGANNIDIFGGNNINTVGTPASNLITISLDDSIQLPVTIADGTAGVIALGATALPGGYITDRFIHNFGINNTFIGGQSANMTLTSEGCTSLGVDTLQSLTSGSNNLALGGESGIALENGSENIFIGLRSGDSLISGSENIFIGQDSGTNMTTESSCIYINNPGTIADANTIRIGDQGNGAGQQDTIFVSGIYQTTVGAVNEAVVVDSTGKLGTAILFEWTEVTGTSQAMAVESGYIANNAGLVTLTLPAVAAVGDRVAIVGKGAGGWNLAQNAGQTLHFIAIDTTTGVGGSLASTAQFDSVEVICITTNTDWVVRSSMGNLTIV